MQSIEVLTTSAKSRAQVLIFRCAQVIKENGITRFADFA